MVDPIGMEPGTLCTPIPCPPVPNYACVIAWALIPCIRLWVDDIFRLRPISSFLTVLVCEIQCC